MVLEIQQSIPVSVERQQPVFFLDAFGNFAPFHLEFITSWEVSRYIVFRLRDNSLNRMAQLGIPCCLEN